MKINTEVISYVASAIGSLFVLVAIVYGLYWQCKICSDQARAEWRQKMDFAQRNGGVFEPLHNRVVFPDGKIIILGSQ